MADLNYTSGDPLVFMARKWSMETVSTLLTSSVLLAVLAAWSGQKPNEILGVGDPTASTVLTAEAMTRPWSSNDQVPVRCGFSRHPTV